MQVHSEIQLVRKAVTDARKGDRRIGCVPTMGALHAGHVSLMERSRAEGCFTVASIFVNPTQFGPNEDFSKYPRTTEADLMMCADAGVDVVFLPTVETMYPPLSQTTVSVNKLTTMLEGHCRPGHFAGVTTVVMKLFQIMQPDVAYFGQKDFQQLRVIQQMVEDLNLPIDVVGCPTIREHDGLAMSSRNRYLSAEEREQALCLYRCLKLAEKSLLEGKSPKLVRQEMQDYLNGLNYIKLQYATLADPKTLLEVEEAQAHYVGLIALYLGKTRLIDNMHYQN
jgi:pantoate--beta-alanine ligase